MAKYMVKASYSTDGIRGLSKEGGTGRQAAVKKVVEALGGKLEAFYFAYGEADAYVTIDLPNSKAAIALSLAVNATGAVRISLIPLITPEEMDKACKTAVSYRAPGA